MLTVQSLLNVQSFNVWTVFDFADQNKEFRSSGPGSNFKVLFWYTLFINELMMKSSFSELLEMLALIHGYL
jgi:hypothetical protein